MPEDSDREAEVKRWEDKIAALRKERMAGRPLTAKLQSAVTKLKNAQEAHATAREAVSKLTAQLEEAQQAEKTSGGELFVHIDDILYTRGVVPWWLLQLMRLLSLKGCPYQKGVLWRFVFCLTELGALRWVRKSVRKPP